mgnify:CR=1 FL=1
MTTTLATTQTQAIAAPNASKEALNSLWMHAKMLADSDIVPKAYQGKPNNCLIAIELAARLGTAPMLVMQNLDIIQGKPSWSSKFLIATVNACGRFSPLRFRFDGKPGTKDWSCTAFATERETGELLEGITVSMAMAEAEGWLGKQGSKWKSMPQLMLTYRAAAFWTRIYAPEVSMGLHTSDEVEDVSASQMPRGGMPESLRDSLLSEGVAIKTPELAAPRSETEQEQAPQSEPSNPQPANHTPDEKAS